MSTMIEPGFIFSTAAAVTSTGGLRPGHLGRGDDDVHAADRLVELGLLGGALLGGQLAGVAARAGGVDLGLELDELRAQALGLLARLGPHVVRVDHGAQALRGADRLEAGDADAQDQDVGGLGRAGGGRQQREVARVRVGRDQDRLVAADVRLRRQRVHRLRPAERARDRVEADRRHARVGEGLRTGRVDQRLQEARRRPGPCGAGRPRSRCGFWTRSTTSDVAYRSSVETTVAPASANAWSGMAAPAPAPASTRTSSPAAVSLPSTSGTRATRRSPAAVSLATPTFMGITNSRNMGLDGTECTGAAAPGDVAVG